jgi:hypothetical protein
MRVSRWSAFATGFAYCCYINSEFGTKNRKAEYQIKQVSAKVANGEQVYPRGKVFGEYKSTFNRISS